MDFGKLFSFEGRVGRGTYWKMVLINVVIAVVTFGIAAITESGFFLFLSVIVYLVMTVIGLATNVKRWHDRDKGWTWILISAIPIIGPFWALIECGFLEGTYGPNQYGTAESGSPFEGDAMPSAAPAYRHQ